MKQFPIAGKIYGLYSVNPLLRIYLALFFIVLMPHRLAGQTYDIVIPDTIGSKGQILEIPVLVSQTANVDSFEAMDFHMSFNNNYIKWLGWIKEGTLSQALGLSAVNYDSSKSKVIIAAATASTIYFQPNTILLKVQFEIIAESPGSISNITITKLMLDRALPSYTIPLSIGSGRVIATETKTVSFSTGDELGDFTFSDDTRVHTVFSASEAVGREVTVDYLGQFDPSAGFHEENHGIWARKQEL